MKTAKPMCRIATCIAALALCCVSPVFSAEHPDWKQQDREWTSGFFSWGHLFHEVDATPADEQGRVLRVGVRYFAITVVMIPVWCSDASYVALVEGSNPISGKPASGYMTFRDYMLPPVVDQYGSPVSHVPGYYRWTPWVLLTLVIVLGIIGWIMDRRKPAGATPGSTGSVSPTGAPGPSSAP
jgi:hypothetical protein